MPLLTNDQAAFVGALRALILSDVPHAATKGGAAKALASRGQMTLGFEEEEERPLPTPPKPPEGAEAVRLLMEYELDSMGIHLSFHPCLTPEGVALARLARHRPQDVAQADQGQCRWVTASCYAEEATGSKGGKYAKGHLDTHSGTTPCTFRGSCAEQALLLPRDRPAAFLCRPRGDGTGVFVMEVMSFQEAARRLTEAVVVKPPHGASLDPVADCLKQSAQCKAGREAALFLQDGEGAHYRVKDAWVNLNALGKGLAPLRAAWGNDAVELWGPNVPLRQGDGSGRGRIAQVQFPVQVEH